MTQHYENAKMVRFKTRTSSETTVSLEWDGAHSLNQDGVGHVFGVIAQRYTVYGFAYRVHLWAEGAA